MKIRYSIILISLLFATQSCKSDDNIELIHSEDKLVEVMTDLYIMDSALKDLEQREEDSLKAVYTKQLETIHKIKLSEIEKDIKELQLVPKYYREIHKRVEDTLATRAKEFK